MSVQAESMEGQAARVRLVGTHPTASGPPRDLEQPIVVLGSGAGCDVILASSKVDASHTAIVQLAGAAYVCDLGAPGGSQLNGRRVRWARLANGDEICIGSFRYRIEFEAAAALCPDEEPVFRLRNEQTIGVVASIDPVLIIGSDPGCDVVLHDERIAARHCVVVWTQEGPILRTLQRREIPRLNGNPVEFARLVNGDAIGIGPFEVIFETNPGGPDDDSNEREEEPGGEVFDLTASFDPSDLVAGRLTSEELPVLSALWPKAELPDGAPGDAVDVVPAPEEAIESSQESRTPRASHPAAPAAAGKTDRDARDRSAGASREPADPDSRSRELDRRMKTLRARIVAAQGALDERAQKHRRRLEQEREHLKACRLGLQTQAEKLLKFARERDAIAGNSEGGAERTATGKAMENPDLEALKQKSRELSELVRIGREEVSDAERRRESLRLEIERLQGLVARAHEKHRVRDTELEARFRTLEKTQQRLRQERDELLARLRGLDAQEAALAVHIKESERCRSDFEREAVRLAEAQAKLEERQRELRLGVEKERQRVAARHAELQRKTADLAKATREKRRAIEAEMARKLAELDPREAELNARRAGIEAAAREALERTASELEGVLNVGLGRIESELKTRQAHLDAQACALLQGGANRSGSPSDHAVANIASSAEPPATTTAASSPRRREEPGQAGARLETLLGEIEAVQTALTSMEDAQRGRAAPSQADAEKPVLGGSVGRMGQDRHASGADLGQLSEKVASLRGSPDATDDGTMPFALKPLGERDAAGRDGADAPRSADP